MAEKHFIVNTGSQSKKYALYIDKQKNLYAHFEKNQGNFIVNLTINGKAEKLIISESDYVGSISYLTKLMLAKGLIQSKQEISIVGLRIVAPGSFFLSNKLIDKNYLSELYKAKQEASLHINPIIEEIENLQLVFPNTTLVGVSDSLFHITMPQYSRIYGIPMKATSQLEIYRFGYHGISFQSILRKIKNLLGVLPKKIIICHLGGGSSITAIKNGRSQDTSMGFTPLEGLPMTTRVGNIDAGAVIYLARKAGLNLDELEEYLNSRSGLKGIDGETGDIRELLALEKNGDKKASLALEVFVYQIKKYIGAYTATLNGLDLLVFSATIGERSPTIRSRICQNLDYLGVVLNEQKNKQVIGEDGFINGRPTRVKIAVIVTNEMEEIANQTREFLKGGIKS